MNEVVNVGMETAVVAPTTKQEIVGTLLDTFIQLPKEFQMVFYVVGLLSEIGLIAYGISQGYGVKKTVDGLYFTNREPVIRQ